MTITTAGIKCGSCHGRHDTIADVKLCSKMNLKTPEFVAEIQRRERVEDEQAAAAKWLREETLTEEYHRQQAALADGERAAARIESAGRAAWTTEDEDLLWSLPREIECADRAAQDRWDSAWTRKPAALRRNAVERPTLDKHAGMYRRPTDGIIWKVQKAVHGSGHLYAKRLISPVDGEPSTAYFEMDKGAIYGIELAWRMTIEEAREYGALYGVCCVCARTLTDERSIEAGIGPVCVTKV